MTNRSEPLHVYLWHDRVHTERGGARLLIWRLSFGPDYVEKRVYVEIEALFEEFGIESFVVYEMLGEYDLLIRFWLPDATTPEDFDAVLTDRLEPVALWSHQYLAVRKVVRHWAWPESASPTDDAIAKVSGKWVSEIAEFNAVAMRQYFAPSDFADAQDEPAAPEWLTEAEAENLIRPVVIGKKGIRFFLHFDFPQRPFRSQTDFAVISDAIEVACDRAVDNSTVLDSEQRVIDRARVSLYAGLGNWTNFLVIAQAPDGEFYSFARDLIFGIRDSRAVHNFHIRPYTHVAADRAFKRFVDNPVVQRSDDPIARFLSGPETNRYELKGTLSVNFDKRLNGGLKGIDADREYDVIKALCGLLNRPTVGRLIIGALERGRYRRLREVADAGAVLGIPNDDGSWTAVDDPETSSPAAVVPLLGVEFEVENGASFKDLDAFNLHLTNLLSSWIQPNPMGNLVIEHETVLGRTIASILVTPGRTRWFYARRTKGGPFNAFYVREAAGTREYGGEDADNYRAISPRGAT